MKCTCGQPLFHYGWVYRVAGCYDPAIFLVDTPPAVGDEEAFDDEAWAASFAEMEYYLTRAGDRPKHDLRNVTGSIRAHGQHSDAIPHG